MKRLVMIWLLLFSVGAVADTRDGLTDADAVAIRAVVQLQLDALAEDEAAIAFDQATTERKLQIGTPDNFLRIIKEQYNPVYRHRTAIFSTPRLVHGMAIQVVRLTDGVGNVWVAVFKMERDDGKSWKIDGCQLFETTSVSV